MITFIQQNLANIGIGGVLLFLFFIAMRKVLRDKKKGKCSGCSGCDHKNQAS